MSLSILNNRIYFVNMSGVAFLLSNVLLMLTGALWFPQASADVQIFKVCYAQRCSGEDFEVFRSSVRNFSRVVSKGKAIHRYCSQSPSVWTAYEEPEFDEEETSNVGRRTLDHVSGNDCVMGSSIKLGSFRHVGNAETHKSGLSLYAKSLYAGHELYFEGDRLQLPEPISVKSNCFTGIDRWELYRGKDFDGDSTCLQAKVADEYGSRTPICTNGLAYYDEFIELNSVIRGCLRASFTISEIHPAGPPYPKPNKNSALWLTLYTEKNKRGKKLHIDGTLLRLPSVYNFASFEMRGTWQTFTGRYFDGNSTCINLYTNKDLGNEGGSIEVGSIKLGCGHLPDNIPDEQDDDEANVSAASVKDSGIFHLVSIFAAIYRYR